MSGFTIEGVSRMSMVTNEAEIDRLARTLAARAGVVWDQLNSYPGFERGRWRSEAKRLLAMGELPIAA